MTRESDATPPRRGRLVAAAVVLAAAVGGGVFLALDGVSRPADQPAPKYKPRRFVDSAGYATMMIDDRGTGSVAVDADITTLAGVAGDERRIAAGGEVWTVTRVLGLRGGLSRNTVGTEKTSLNAGVSVAVRPNRYVDGQITRGSDELRHGWGVGLRVTF